MLRSRPDVSYAEVLSMRDGDAYVYHVESTQGVDIRKALFHAFSAKGWPIIGFVTLGMSLEDIFISVVDKTESAQGDRRVARRGGKKAKGLNPEGDLAQQIIDATAKKQEQIAPYAGEE